MQRKRRAHWSEHVAIACGIFACVRVDAHLPVERQRLFREPRFTETLMLSTRREARRLESWPTAPPDLERARELLPRAGQPLGGTCPRNRRIAGQRSGVRPRSVTAEELAARERWQPRWHVWTRPQPGQNRGDAAGEGETLSGNGRLLRHQSPVQRQLVFARRHPLPGTGHARCTLRAAGCTQHWSPDPGHHEGVCGTVRGASANIADTKERGRGVTRSGGEAGAAEKEPRADPAQMEEPQHPAVIQ